MKMWKKITTLAMSGVLLAGTALSVNVDAQEISNEVNMPQKAERPEYNTTPPIVNNKWDGTSKDTEWLGQGTKKSPYLIFTPEEFVGMLNSTESHQGAYYKLMNDINLNKQSGFRPRWDYYGVFDGNDHCIVGLNLGYLGLFGNIQEDASVSNLTLYGACKNGSVFCGLLYGTMTNCVSYVNCTEGGGGLIRNIIESARVESCYNYGEYVLDSVTTVGGIVSSLGHNCNATISNCANFGDITVQNGVNAVGGIVAHRIANNAQLNIESCENYGDIYCSSDCCIDNMK